MKLKENYADVIRSLRICANESEEEGCEGCIYETDDCDCARKLLRRASCVIEDLCELYWKTQQEGRKNESVREMQMETDMHTVRPEPLQAEEGLGSASEKERPEESPLDKLSADLRTLSMLDSHEKRAGTMRRAAEVLKIISDVLQIAEDIRVAMLVSIGEVMK